MGSSAIRKIGKQNCEIIIERCTSGCTEPSSADIQSAKKIGQAGELLGIKLLDSIIIAGDAYLSLFEKGLLK